MGDKGEDLGEGMQCSDHPYRNNPGGICAFCLQEKLGKLVSSSKSTTFFPVGAPSSSSSSPSRSEGGGSSAAPPISHLGRTQIPFFAHKKKKVMSTTLSSDASLILKRSRSVAVARHLASDGIDDSPRKKGFWSFLHLSRRRGAQTQREGKQQQQQQQQQNKLETKREEECGGDENESPNSSHASSFGRKVARSRSVGCGSRSFSGDFLERISTGLGDCALRRVESQREAKPKIVLHRDDRIKEKVKCGGIFGGFGSSSSSSYWISSEDFNGRIPPGPTPHGRSRSWGWAFASPMRAFRPSTRSSIIIAENAKDGCEIVHHISRPNTTGTANTTTTTATSTKNNHHHKVDTSPSLLVVRG